MTVWDSVGLIYFVIFVVLGLFTYWMLNKYHMIGGNTAVKKAKKERQQYADLQTDIHVVQTFLGACEHFCDLVGNGVTDADVESWDYIIKRIFPTIKLINRKMTVKEFIGLLRAITFIFIVIGAIMLLIGAAGFGVVCIAIALLLKPAIVLITHNIVDAKDASLERDFPSLYLLLYSRLIRGVNARLGPTLLDYTRSMNAIYLPNEHKEIREFVYDFRNLIEVYADETIALNELKKKYHSAMMVNFINLATQAIRGTNNQDSLLAFKMELANREVEQMKAEAAKRADKARSVVNVVFAILFEFIILAVASKMPNLGSIFSMLG